MYASSVSTWLKQEQWSKLIPSDRVTEGYVLAELTQTRRLTLSFDLLVCKVQKLSNFFFKCAKTRFLFLEVYVFFCSTCLAVITDQHIAAGYIMPLSLVVIPMTTIYGGGGKGGRNRIEWETALAGSDALPLPLEVYACSIHLGSVRHQREVNNLLLLYLKDLNSNDDRVFSLKGERRTQAVCLRQQYCEERLCNDGQVFKINVFSPSCCWCLYHLIQIQKFWFFALRITCAGFPSPT